MSYRGQGQGQGYRGRGQSNAGQGGDRGRGQGYRGQSGDRGGGGRGRSGDRGGGGQQTLAHRDAKPNPVYLLGKPIPEPDKAVKDTEDRLLLVTKGQTIGNFPGRTSYGTQGRAITLRTNYLRLAPAEDKQPTFSKTLYRYTVVVTPEPSKLKRKQLMRQIVNLPVFTGKTLATDYGSIIVTTEKLSFNGQQSMPSTRMVIQDANGRSAPAAQGSSGVPQFVQEARQRNTVSFTIEFDPDTDVFDANQLIEHLRSRDSTREFEPTSGTIQLLNIIFCKPASASLSVTRVGSKFYPFQGDPLMDSFNLGAGLDALRGYYSSVRPTVGRLLVNVNVTSGAFYQPLPLIALLEEFRGSLEQQEAHVDRIKVRVDYIKDKETKPFDSRVKTIVGFAKSQAGQYTDAKHTSFRKSATATTAARDITVFDYFRESHLITLKEHKRPVLNCGTSDNPQYIPQELCTVLPGQPFKKLLPSSNQTSAMIRFAARRPPENAASIAGDDKTSPAALQLFHLANASRDIAPQTNGVKRFGFKVLPDLITVPGRILTAPNIRYKNRNLQVKGATWNLIDTTFLQPGQFYRWKVITICHSGPKGNTWEQFGPNDNHANPAALYDDLGAVLKGHGISLGQGRGTSDDLQLLPLTSQNRQANNATLEAAFVKAKNQSVSILLIVIPDQDKWLYARIKYYADVKYGIHTVCTIGRKFQHRGKPLHHFKGFCGNLALKFNVKGGGVSHAVPDTLMQPVGDKTMLVGIDVTHPSPGSSKGAPSIACVVANTDKNLFQWPGSIRTQEGREEMVQGLKEMVLERLRVYRKKNNDLPDKVVIYRDGVSESQFDTVLEKEWPAFQEAYREMYPADRQPKSAIIIVGKRHHTRFYPTKIEDTDNTNNPLPGTVVDRGVVGRIIHEFYLQPHQGLQGTARPAHYCVIKNEIGFDANSLERLTHNLCHYFVRSTKAVSICPPAYYADLLAERGRCYLYSVLQENSTLGATFNLANAPWSRDVHANLAESTWYV